MAEYAVLLDSDDAGAGSFYLTSDDASTTFGSGDVIESGVDTAAGTGTVSITGSGAIIELGDTAAGTGIAGNQGSGAATETGVDTAAGTGFRFASGAHIMYSIDPATWRTDAGSLGSSVTGTPTINDKLIVPTTDGSLNFTWELDSNGNATGALASITGTGNSVGNNWGLYDSTTPVWRFATFDAASGSISGSGSATESGSDTAAGVGFYFGTGSHLLYTVNPATWRTDVGSVGSGVTGTPVSGDKVLLPSTDGTVNFTWELDSGGNATGALSSISGSGLSTGNNWGYYDSTTPVWRFATFDATQGHVGSGAATETSPDTVAGTGKVNVIGSGAITEPTSDTATGTGSIDITAPAFTAGPSSASVQVLSYLVNFTTDESGNYRAVTMLSTDTPPSASEVLLGTGAGGATPIHATTLGSMTAAVSKQVSVDSGLVAAGSYITYVAVRDATGNARIANTGVVTTSASPDTTAPSFTTGPDVTSITQTTAVFSGIVDESGNYGLAVLPAAAGAPGGSPILAGTAGGPFSASSTPMTINVLFNRTMTGLLADTDYKLHIALQDSSGNVRVVSTSTFHTAVAVNTGIDEEVIDVDTGALVTSITGIKVSIRETSDAEATLDKTTTASINSNGRLVFASTNIGDAGDFVYMTMEYVSGLVYKIGTYRIQVKDLG